MYGQIVCAYKYCENADSALLGLRQASVCSLEMPTTLHQLLRKTV